MFGRKKKKERRVRNRPNKNTQPSVYKETTDKVGDVLENGAGVKYKITGQRYRTPSGYDDGKLKIRILKIEPDKSTGLKPFEMNDQELKHWREKKVLIRLPREKRGRKPTAKSATKPAAKNKRK